MRFRKIRSMSFRKKLDKLSRKHWNLKCYVLLVFVMFVCYSEMKCKIRECSLKVVMK